MYVYSILYYCTSNNYNYENCGNFALCYTFSSWDGSHCSSNRRLWLLKTWAMCGNFFLLWQQLIVMHLEDVYYLSASRTFVYATVYWIALSSISQYTTTLLTRLLQRTSKLCPCAKKQKDPSSIQILIETQNSLEHCELDLGIRTLKLSHFKSQIPLFLPLKNCFEHSQK